MNLANASRYRDGKARQCGSRPGKECHVSALIGKSRICQSWPFLYFHMRPRFVVTLLDQSPELGTRHLGSGRRHMGPGLSPAAVYPLKGNQNRSIRFWIPGIKGVNRFGTSKPPAGLRPIADIGRFPTATVRGRGDAGLFTTRISGTSQFRTWTLEHNVHHVWSESCVVNSKLASTYLFGASLFADAFHPTCCPVEVPATAPQ